MHEQKLQLESVVLNCALGNYTTIYVLALINLVLLYDTRQGKS